MGKIYNDILEDDNLLDEATKKLIENLESVSILIDENKNVKFRDTEINRVYNIMTRSEFRSVLLVGDFGSGKRSIIEGYVHKNNDRLRDDLVYEIDYDKIIKKSKQEDFVKIIEDIFDLAGNSNITLVLNNFGNILNTNCYGNSGFSMINNIISSIKNDNISIIATATNNEFKMIEDMYKNVLNYFTVIKLNELSKEESTEILKDGIDYYSKYYNFVLPENTSEIICNNADKYIKDSVFPGKAFRLIDEVCSSIFCKKSRLNQTVLDLDTESDNIKEQLRKAFEEGDIDKCNELHQQLLNNEELMDDAPLYLCDDNNITEEEILEAIGEITGVNMTKLSDDKTKFLREMPIELKKKVIGQDETVDKIVKNIRRNQLGLRKSAHSAGNFIFIGSTGVGKTYLAKQLAKYLYGSEDNLLRLDMSEFQTEIDVNKLLGSAPGYIGYKESGVLVKGLAKKPETVVLFDEIEKAHPKIYDVLLQLLDEGFVTGSDGVKVDATKSLIIFTSNIGVRQAREMSSPLGFTDTFEQKKNSRKEEIITKALKKRFSPEFLNRLDGICYFNSLDKDTLKTILYKELDEINDGIKMLTNKTVKITENVESWLIDKVEKEDNGARPIIRLLQQEIEEQIAEMIVNEDSDIYAEGDTLLIDLENDKIVLK